MPQGKLYLALAGSGLFAFAILLFSVLHNAVVDWGLLIGMIGAGVLSFLAITIAVRRRPVANLLVIGFLLRLVVAIAYTVYLADSDPDGYGPAALQMLSQGPGGLLQDIPLGAYFYSWLIAWVWMIFGESYFLIRVMNAFLSFLAIVVFYDLGRKLFNPDVAKKLLIVVVFFPTLIRFSGLFPSREALAVLFVMLITYLVYQLYATQKLKYLIFTLSCILVASILHTGFFIYGIILLGIILFTKFRKGRKAFMLIPALGITVAMGAWMFSSGIGTEKLYLTDGSIDPDRIIALQDGSSASGRAAYLTDTSPTDISGSITSLPARFVYFMYAPFPWMVRGFLDILGLIDALAYIALTWIIIKNRKIWKLDNKNKQYFSALAIALIISISGFAIGTSNYGTALRHRAKFVMPIVILSGAGLKSQEKRRYD